MSAMAKSLCHVTSIWLILYHGNSISQYCTVDTKTKATLKLILKNGQFEFLIPILIPQQILRCYKKKYKLYMKKTNKKNIIYKWFNYYIILY